jgi:glutathionyl-hydroquinone reductase
MESLAQLEDALAVAVSLGAQTTEAWRFEQLDAALRTNDYDAWLKGASLTPKLLDEDSALVNAAADALHAVQAHFRFFAKLGGRSWRYGQLPCPLSQRSVLADRGPLLP